MPNEVVVSNENLVKSIDDDYDDYVGPPRPSTSCGRSACCDPYGITHRFIVFVFMCFLNFGNYFCYDNPSALQEVIEKTVDIDSQQFGYLYAVYSWPNVILSFFGGYLIDWVLGIRWGSIIFAAFIAAGQFVFALGGYMDLFWLMLFGRLIFAIGGENLGVAQNTYTVKWFKGKELNAVFGIQLSFARAGSTVNQFAMLPIYNALASSSGKKNTYDPKALGSALFIAFVFCLLSLVCGIVLWWFDRRRDKFLDLQYEYDVKHAKSDAELPQEPDKTVITPKEILKFPLTFWLVCFVCVTFYCAIFPFVSFGQLFYVNKFDMSTTTAADCNGIIFLIAIPASVVSGLLVDYFGRNVQFVGLSVALALFGHCILAFSFLSPYIATAILGIAYSLLASALWPCVAYVVPEHTMATAYGVMQSIQNFGLAILAMLVGLIVDNKGYFVLELFFVAVLCLSLGLSLFLYFADLGRECLLIMDGKTRRKILAGTN